MSGIEKMKSIADLKKDVRTGRTTEIVALYSNRIFAIRWRQGRLEIKAPNSDTWRFASKQILMSDFGIDREPLPPIPGDILELLD